MNDAKNLVYFISRTIITHQMQTHSKDFPIPISYIESKADLHFDDYTSDMLIDALLMLKDRRPDQYSVIDFEVQT